MTVGAAVVRQLAVTCFPRQVDPYRIGDDVHVIGIRIPEVGDRLEPRSMGVHPEPRAQFFAPPVHRAVAFKALDALFLAMPRRRACGRRAYGQRVQPVLS